MSEKKPAPPAAPKAQGQPDPAVIVAVAAIALAIFLVWVNWAGPPLPRGARIDRLVVEKGAHRLLAYQQGRLLKAYSVSEGPETGAKRREGDGRTPEGIYVIDRHNRASRFHRSLHVSYPSAQDRRRARQSGYSPGGDIMVHGLPNGRGWMGRFYQISDWTAGCIALTDPEIEELYRATPDGTPIEIRP